MYFDIDGALLDLDDEPKAALLGGKLEDALKAGDFGFLTFVSEWTDQEGDESDVLALLEKICV